MIRSIYEEAVDVPLLPHTIPEGHQGTLILTHDVDYRPSFFNSEVFADKVEEYGHKNTFFIETRYFKDDLDQRIYDQETTAALTQLSLRGIDLQCHTVGHFPDFADFEHGDPNVKYPEYQPYYYKDPINATTGGTIYGELKVSKFLLDKDFTQNTISFRAGYLAFPNDLSQILDDCGYLYDSTLPANDVLQSFPYYLPEGRHIGGEPTNILEVPLTITDYNLTTETLTSKVDTWLDTLNHYTHNFSPVVCLIHPSNLHNRYNALCSLLEDTKDMDLWRGNFTTYAEFWRARAALVYDWNRTGNILDITIKSPLSAPPISLVFKDKGFITEINVLFQEPESDTVIPLDCDIETKYGYTFITLPTSTVQSPNGWLFF
jgi:hypothetical protein